MDLSRREIPEGHASRTMRNDPIIKGRAPKTGNGKEALHPAVEAKSPLSAVVSMGSGQRGLLAEELFHRMLCLERRRAERSGKMFALVVLDAPALFEKTVKTKIHHRAAKAIYSAMRETDISGWQKKNSAIGIILTEMGDGDKAAIQSAMRAKLTAALHSKLDAEQMDEIRISFHFYPEEWEGRETASSADDKLYPDLLDGNSSKKTSHLIKRFMDVVGSLAALILLAPVLAVIAMAIKLTSKGPILFKQERVGRYGIPFTFLKFRTMQCSSDPKIHREYIKRFISGTIDSSHSNDGHGALYKIADDPRVTRAGKYLRKTSLDELPQFWNVLMGEMSLVGPRPPIPYELESYGVWHRRRVMEIKPGITGLWQVTGRSRTKFDEMVRLDLRYAKIWTPWLDLKILLQTPRAMFSGRGAY